MPDFHATRWPGTPYPGYTAPPSAYVTALGNEALPLYGTDPGPRPYNPLNLGIGGEHGMMLQLGAQYLLPQLMGNKFPAQFNPDQHLYDQLLSRQHSESLQQAGAIAGAQDKSQIERLLNGINRLAAGRELNEAERMRNAGFAGHAMTAMPFLTAALGPDLVDQLHGSSGSSMLLSQYVQAAGRGHIDPITGQRGYSGQTSGMVTQEMFEQLFGPNANKSAMYGLSAGRAGVLMQELQNRGMLGPATGGMPWPDRIGKMGTEYRSVMADMARERDLGNVGNLPQLQTRLREMEGQLLDEGAVNRIAMRLPEIQQLKEDGTLTEPIMEAARAKVRQSHRTLLSSPEQIKDLRDLENLPGGEDILRAGEADRYKARIKNLSGVVKAMRDVFGDRGNPNAPIGQLMAELDKLTQGSLAVMSAGQVENMVRKSRAIARSTGVSLEAQEVLGASITPLTDQLGLHRSFAATSAQGGIMIGQAVADTQRLDRPAWGSLTKNEAAALGTQLQATSAASPLMNALGAAIRMQETGLVQADDPAEAPRNETQALLRAVRAGETTYEWGGQRRSIRKQPGAIKEMLQRDEGVNQATAYSIFADTTGTQEFIQQQGLVEKIGLATQQEEARQVTGGYLGTALRSQINMDPENLNRLRDAGVVRNQSDLTQMTIAVGQAVGQDLVNMDPGVRRDPGLRQKALATAYKQRIQEQVKQRMPNADAATVAAVSDNLLEQLGGERGMSTLAETGWADFNRAMRATPFKSGEGALQMFNPTVQRAKRRHEREQEAAMIMEKSLDPLATVGPIARIVDAMKAAGPDTKLVDILGTAFGGVDLDEIKNRDPDGPMAVALGLIKDTSRLDIHNPADFKIYQRNAKVIRGILEGGEAATSALRDLREEQAREAPEPPQQLRQAERDVDLDRVLDAKSREAEKTTRRQLDQTKDAQTVVRLTEASVAEANPQERERIQRQAQQVISNAVAKAGGLTIDGWKFTGGDRIQKTTDGQTETLSLTTEAGLRQAGQLLTARAAADAPQQNLSQIQAERVSRGSLLVRNADAAWALAKKPEALDTQERVDQAIQVLERQPKDSSLRIALLEDAKAASARWDTMDMEEQREFTTKAQAVLQQQLTDQKTGATQEVGTAGGPRLTASGLVQADSAESRRQMAIVDKSINAYATRHGDEQGELKGIYDGRAYRITGTKIITGDTEEDLGTAKGREMALTRIRAHADQQQKQVDQRKAEQTQRVDTLQAAYGKPVGPVAYEESAEELQLAQTLSRSVEDPVTDTGALEKLIQTLSGQDPNDALKQILGVLRESLGVLKDSGSTEDAKTEAYQRVNATIQAEQQRSAAVSALAQKPPEDKSPEQLAKYRQTIQDYVTSTGGTGIKNAAGDELTAKGIRTKDGEIIPLDNAAGQRRAAQIIQEHAAAVANQPIGWTEQQRRQDAAMSAAITEVQRPAKPATDPTLLADAEMLDSLAFRLTEADAVRPPADVAADEQLLQQYVEQHKLQPEQDTRAGKLQAAKQHMQGRREAEAAQAKDAGQRPALAAVLDQQPDKQLTDAKNNVLTQTEVRTADGRVVPLDTAEGRQLATGILAESRQSQQEMAAAKELEAQEQTLVSRNRTLLDLQRLETEYNKPDSAGRRAGIGRSAEWYIQRHLKDRTDSQEIVSKDELTKLTKDGLLTRKAKDGEWQTQSLSAATPEGEAARAKAAELIKQDLIQQRRDGDKTRSELRSTIQTSQELKAGDTLMTKLGEADGEKAQVQKDAIARGALIKYINAQDGKKLTTADGEVVTEETLKADATTLVGEKGQLTGDGLQLKGEESAAKITDEAQLTTAIEILKAQEGQPSANPKLLEQLETDRDRLADTELTKEQRQQVFTDAQSQMQTSLGSPSRLARAREAATRQVQDRTAAYAAKRVAAGQGTWTTGEYEVDKDVIRKLGKPGKDGKPVPPVETIKRDSPEGRKLLQKLAQQDAATRTQGRHADDLSRAITALEKAQTKPGFEGYKVNDIDVEAVSRGATDTADAIKKLEDPKTDAAAAAAAEKTVQQDGGRVVQAAAGQAAKILAGDGEGGISKDLEQLGQGGLRLLQTIQGKDQELRKLAASASEKLGRNVTVADLLAGVKMDAGDVRQDEADAFSKQARAAFDPLKQAYQEVAERREATKKLPAGAVPGKDGDTRAPMTAFEIEAAKASREFATKFTADKNAKKDFDGDGVSSVAEKQAEDVYGRLTGVVKDKAARGAMTDPTKRKALLQELSRGDRAVVVDRAIRSRQQAIELAAQVTFGGKQKFSELDKTQQTKATAIADNWLQGQDAPGGLDKTQQTELERLRGDAKLLKGFQDVSAEGLDAAAKQAFDDAGLAGDQMGDSQDKKLAVTITGGNITLQEDGRLKVDLSGTSISNGATNKLGINVPTVA